MKFLYTVLPWELPHKERIRILYDRIIGDRHYVTQETEQHLLNGSEEPSVRRLDPLNQWFFDRYLRREFPRVLGEHRSIATSLRRVLETYDFEVQPDTAGRVHYVLSATVPGDRDALVEYLRSQNDPVRVIWNEPWGLTSEHSGPEHRYSGTRFLADNIITFPIAEMNHDDVTKLIRDLRTYYGPRAVSAGSHSPDRPPELRRD